MDDIFFYKPPSASNSQPRLPGARTSPNVSGASSASFPVRQTAPRFDQRNDLSKDDMTKSRDVRDPSQKSHSDQRYGNDTVQMQENLTATRNPPDSDDDDEFPDIDELLTGMKQKNNLASADPNSDNNNDDDDFPDIDELLSGMKQKSVPESAKSNDGNMAEKVDNGTQGDSPDSSRSTEGSTQDPIILSDDESADAESETDYSDLDVDVGAKHNPNPPHLADSELLDDDSVGAAAVLISDCLVAGHQDDKNHNNAAVDKTQFRLLADRPISASLEPGPETHHASKLQVNTEITHRNTGSPNRDVTREVEDERYDAFAKENIQDGNDAHSTKRSNLPARSKKNLAFDSTISELQQSQVDHTHSLHQGPAAASSRQSDLNNDDLPKRLRRGAVRNVRGKRSHREMDGNGSANDSDDNDYANMSDAVSLKKRGSRPSSRKRVRRTKDMEHNNVERPSTNSLDVSCEGVAAVPPCDTYGGGGVPVHGYFTLKTVESKVVYCLTFSQELLPRRQGQRRDCTTDLDEPQSALPVADSNTEWEIRKVIGQKMAGRERHYCVEWKPTWMPETELAGAKGLVESFRANDGSGTRYEKRPLERRRLATGQPNAQDGKEVKKRRGRPRKQT